MYCFTEYESPLGILTLASDGAAVCGLWMADQKYHSAGMPESMKHDDDAPGFAEMRAWLDAYFAGKKPDPASVPLAPIGTDFRQAVWRKLLAIPYGATTTYGAIANELRAERGKASALAVGGAVGHNPLSIIIPCHRVVGSDGNLTGYAGGLKHKIWLLEHEGVDMSALYLPTHGTAL